MEIKDLSTPLDGYKTWLAIAGALSLGIYQLTQQHFDVGVTSIITGIGLIFALHRIERHAAGK